MIKYSDYYRCSIIKHLSKLLTGLHDHVWSFVLSASFLLMKQWTVYVQNYSFESAIEILNTELAKVAFWFDSIKLTLNVNKTQLITLSRKQILTPQKEYFDTRYGHLKT